MLNVRLYEAEKNGDLGRYLTKLRLPAVPSYGDEILIGDPADHFVVRGPAFYKHGKNAVDLGVEVIALENHERSRQGVARIFSLWWAGYEVARQVVTRAS